MLRARISKDISEEQSSICGESFLVQKGRSSSHFYCGFRRCLCVLETLRGFLSDLVCFLVHFFVLEFGNLFFNMRSRSFDAAPQKFPSMRLGWSGVPCDEATSTDA